MPPARKLHLVPRKAPVAALDERTDAELVERILGGELALREVLYARHVDWVAGLATRLLRSVDLAEDAVQEIFVAVFQNLGSLRERAAFRGWLAAISVRTVRHRMRKQRFLRFLGLDHECDGALDALAAPGASPETLAELAALDLVLQKMDPDLRVAWVLRHVEGEKMEDVAQACAVSLSTAKRWVGAAEDEVKRALGEVHDA